MRSPELDCVGEKERVFVCVRAGECARERERHRVCVCRCVCACVRERERECVRVHLQL